MAAATYVTDCLVFFKPDSGFEHGAMTKLAAMTNKIWPAEATSMSCDPFTTENSARLFYGDGASRSGFRREAWPAR